MRKKYLIFILTVFFSICFVVGLAACDNNANKETNSTTNSTQNDSNNNADNIPVETTTATVLNATNATINGNEIYLFVDNTTTNISLSGTLTCSENCVWKLYANDAITEIPTKVITSLTDGTNIYYIVVSSTLDSSVSSTYILTIYKSFTVTVNYYNGSSKLYSETAYTGYTYFADYVPEDITGYTFNYWKTSDGQNYTSTTILTNLNLYADITPNTYTITFKIDNDEEISVTNSNVLYDLQYTLEIPKKSHYIFMGWYYGDIQLTNTEGQSLSVWNFTEDITVTAKWHINQYSINLNISEIDAGNISDSGIYAYGDNITITASQPNLGYTWGGWYNGKILYTSDLSFNYTIATEDMTFTAVYNLAEEMSNFIFTSTTTTCIITGIIDNTKAEINVPDYVTSIAGGAFNGCSNLINITVPFIGENAECSTASASSLLGYIFGTSYYSGGVSIKQYYAKSYYSTYYIPSTLTTVTITGGNILYGTFYNCTSIASITLPDNIDYIGNYAFYNCLSLKNLTIPYNVTFIGYCALSNCTSLASVTFENTNGWIVTLTEDENDGFDIDVTDKSKNITYLTNTYNIYYWYKFNFINSFIIYYNNNIDSCGNYILENDTLITDDTIITINATEATIAFYGNNSETTETHANAFRIENILPLETTNNLVDELTFYYRVYNGSSYIDYEINSSTGSSIGVACSFDSTTNSFFVTSYISGDVYIVLKTHFIESIIHLYIEPTVPTVLYPMIYMYNTSGYSWNNSYSTTISGSVYIGQNLYFSAEAPSTESMYADSSYIANIKDAFDTNGNTISSDYYTLTDELTFNGQTMSAFSATKAGTYTITIASTKDSAIISTIVVTIDDTPEASELFSGSYTAKLSYTPKGKVTITFTASENNNIYYASIISTEGAETLKCTYNDSMLTTEHYSGIDTGFTLTFNEAYDLVISHSTGYYDDEKQEYIMETVILTKST